MPVFCSNEFSKSLILGSIFLILIFLEEPAFFLASNSACLTDKFLLIISFASSTLLFTSIKDLAQLNQLVANVKSKY